ncbi:unnamed protein product [Urochloa decumbens]|uniref:Fe2OG dioxygenase domain-containing protein n=1 Tax=Urochloa decumbens TaxID=240449 RepID=A0ABC9GFS4_9POAL
MPCCLLMLYLCNVATTTEAAAAGGGYDRLSELKAFDDTKAGVKGLVDAGITTVPAIFRHPHHQLPSSSSSTITIPVIDLSAADAAADADARAEVVAQVKATAETVGFFQLVNHGAHSDPSFLTVLLLQDGAGAGGLQARLGHGGEWADVAPPVAGALLVNVGDLMQLVSNGRFRSVEHRVVATSRSAAEARVSVACFCNADVARDTTRYGPIPELTSGAEGAVYRSVTVPEFLAHYDGKGLDGRPALDHFRLR